MRYIFQRDYQQKWTTEIFKVSNRYLKENIPQYKVVDLLNRYLKENIPQYIVVDLLDSEVIGSFYEWEILHVNNDFQFWGIESILKTRKRKERIFDKVGRLPG